MPHAHNKNKKSEPWIGFVIREAPGRKNTFLVVEVADDGPAAEAGISNGDEIVSFDGRTAYNVSAYKRLLKGWHPGQTVKLEVLRGGRGVDKKEISVKLGELKKELVKDPPPFRNLVDVRAILNDKTKVKLEKFNTVLFSECDEDLSGLVTKQEFVSTIGPWLKRYLDIQLPRARLEEIFDLCDADNSGFLRKSEFLSLTEGFLAAIVQDADDRLSPGSAHNIKRETKSWIGFEIRRAPGVTNNLIVVDVVLDGPADKAGICNGDEILAVDCQRVHDVDAYLSLLKGWRPGQTVHLEVLRGGRGVDRPRKIIPVKIGARKKEVVKDPPHFRNLQDVHAILNDRNKLKKFNTVLFNRCDADMSGLVTLEEFVSSIGPWITRELPMAPDESQLVPRMLKDVFDAYDKDESGFLRKSEFLPVTKGFLEAILDEQGHRLSPGSAHNSDDGTKPWIGFEIRSAPGWEHLLVVDVADDGPADKAGISNGDGILSVDGHPVPNVEAYLKMMKGWRPRQTVLIEVLRDDPDEDDVVKINFPIKIGEVKKPVVQDAPPFRNLEDVRAILKDRTKLEKFNTVMFTQCDEDMSGLVSIEEFVSTIGPWMEQYLNLRLSESRLATMFNDFDEDESGYLRKSEFTPLTRDFLKTILERNGIQMDHTVRRLEADLDPDCEIYEATADDKVESSWLGFSYCKTPGGSSILVTDVVDDGPAYKAGLYPGDEIVRADYLQILSVDIFKALLLCLPPGRMIPVELVRQGRPDPNQTTRTAQTTKPKTTKHTLLMEVGKEHRGIVPHIDKSGRTWKQATKRPGDTALDNSLPAFGHGGPRLVGGLARDY